MREWLWRLRAMWRRDREAEARAEELQTHYDMALDEARGRGLDDTAAAREARRRAGTVADAAVSTHESLGIRWLDGAAHDLRAASRALRRDRGFSGVTVAVLGSSVAVATLVFIVADAVLLRPLPYPEPDRLIRIYDTSVRSPKFPVSIGHFEAYRDSARTLEGIALYTGRDLELAGDGQRPVRLTGVAVTDGFFALLGTAPLWGRDFTREEVRTGARVAILNHALWRERFQADPGIIGRAVRLDRETWTVTGVLPPGVAHVGGEYRSPRFGDTVDVWTPLQTDGSDGMRLASHYCNALGRLGPGRSLDEAGADLQALAAASSATYPDFGTWTATLAPLAPEITGRVRPAVTLLAAAGLLVLLVACTNIAGLCVARGLARRDEQAVRTALGANRWHLIRVALAENLLVGAVASLVGLVGAAVLAPALARVLPIDFVRIGPMSMTWRSAAVAIGIGVSASLLAALFAPRTPSMTGSRRTTADLRGRRIRTVLVAAEMALAGLLCAGTILLWQSARHIESLDHGFSTDDVLTFQVTLPQVGEPAPGAMGRRIEAMRQALVAVPSVTHAGVTTNLPWSGYDENAGYRIVGRDAPEDDSHAVRFQAASPGYVDATGMRILEGRGFDPARDAFDQPKTILLNDAAARRDFPNGDAVGARVQMFGAEREVVGVVRGLRDHPTLPEVEPAIWFPLTQVEFPRVFAAVRTNGADPLAIVPAVRAAVQAVDSELALADVQTLETHAGAALAAQRAALFLFEVFALLALGLAAAGLYGLLGYLVQQRRKEFGIRAAIGATRNDLAVVVIRDGLRTAMAGTLACLVAMPFAGRLMASVVFGASPTDPAVFLGTPLVLLGAACLAAAAPALGVSRDVDVSTLREN